MNIFPWLLKKNIFLHDLFLAWLQMISVAATLIIGCVVVGYIIVIPFEISFWKIVFNATIVFVILTMLLMLLPIPYIHKKHKEKAGWELQTMREEAHGCIHALNPFYVYGYLLPSFLVWILFSRRS